MNKKHMESTLDPLFEEMGVLPEMNERIGLRAAYQRRRAFTPSVLGVLATASRAR